MTTSTEQEFVRRILIEAIEGCGIRHWAGVQHWDGEAAAVITDLGGDSFRLTVENLIPLVRAHFGGVVDRSPMEVDSYLADEILQTQLFGGVIYRTQVQRRPTTGV